MLPGGSSLSAAWHRSIVVDGEPGVLAVDGAPPPAARALIWQEFFQSRGRGIDWVTHLPWVGQASSACASVSIGSEVVAALLIRILPGTATAMIGYVCVDNQYRGRGLSRILLELSIEWLSESNLDQVVLWTSKPGVYDTIGFMVGGQARNLRLRIESMPSVPGLACVSWPGSAIDQPGLPPFATAGYCATLGDARIAFADTATGATLLDLHGEPEAVYVLMAILRPGNWSAALDPSDRFYDYAVSNSLVVDDTAGPFVMYRSLANAEVVPIRIPVAMRI